MAGRGMLEGANYGPFGRQRCLAQGDLQAVSGRPQIACLAMLPGWLESIARNSSSQIVSSDSQVGQCGAYLKVEHYAPVGGPKQSVRRQIQSRQKACFYNTTSIELSQGVHTSAGCSWFIHRGQARMGGGSRVGVSSFYHTVL
jgi:hypothetical protein